MGDIDTVITSIDLDRGAGPGFGLQLDLMGEDIHRSVNPEEVFRQVLIESKPVSRIIITGSRQWPKIDVVHSMLDCLYREVEKDAVLVHGACRGIDLESARYWERVGGRTESWPADWTREGRRAGVIRNQMMVRSGADLCVGFIYRESRGATHCVGQAETMGIPVVVFRMS